jgi:hypothetical protein
MRGTFQRSNNISHYRSDHLDQSKCERMHSTVVPMRFTQAINSNPHSSVGIIYFRYQDAYQAGSAVRADARIKHARTAHDTILTTHSFFLLNCLRPFLVALLPTPGKTSATSSGDAAHRGSSNAHPPVTRLPRPVPALSCGSRRAWPARRRLLVSPAASISWSCSP